MKPEEVQVGRCYDHKGFGHVIVCRRTRNGFWVLTWGGPGGDKQYTFKGINAADLTPKTNGCK